MATIYRTRDGDVLDRICYAHYGYESAVVDVLTENKGLVELGVILPSGIEIILPDLTAPVADSGVNLWD
jgi:phage tail protein X